MTKWLFLLWETALKGENMFRHENLIGMPTARVGLIYGNNMTLHKNNFSRELAEKYSLTYVGLPRDYNSNPNLPEGVAERILEELDTSRSLTKLSETLGSCFNLAPWDREALLKGGEPLSSGRGFNNLVRVLAAILTSEKGVLIECPEFCLNPKAVVVLTDTVLHHATWTRPIILETHSEIFTLRLRRRLRERQRGHSNGVTIHTASVMSIDDKVPLQYAEMNSLGDWVVPPEDGMECVVHEALFSPIE